MDEQPTLERITKIEPGQLVIANGTDHKISVGRVEAYSDGILKLALAQRQPRRVEDAYLLLRPEESMFPIGIFKCPEEIAQWITFAENPRVISVVTV